MEFRNNLTKVEKTLPSNKADIQRWRPVFVRNDSMSNSYIQQLTRKICQHQTKSIGGTPPLSRCDKRAYLNVKFVL